jgi:carboxyl-terminal processing protease
LLALLLLAWPAAAEPFVVGQGLNQPLVSQVTATALTFMAPRTLEAVPIGQLALWGLRGLTTLDSRLVPEAAGGVLQLKFSDRVILTRAPPASDDAAGWGEAVAQLCRAAWDVSEPVRQASTAGLIHTFFDELFNHLDPYSRYVPPKEAEEDRLRRQGEAGIGAHVVNSGKAFFLRDITADGPAARAGIRSGDQLLAVDNEPTGGADLAAVRALLTGPPDTRVLLRLRARNGRVRNVEISRALVPPETVTTGRIADALVLRVSGFSSDTGARLANEITRGLAGPHPPRGVIIDLRGNRGGLLRQAVAAAEVLQPSGVVAVTVGRDPAADHEFRADAVDLGGGRPVVVVVDGRSASAAEILAAALADQHRAVVVGSTTLGKGLVQTIAPLPDGGDLVLTWSRVLAPLGWPIQSLGVLPQLCTSLGQDRLDAQMAELADGHEMLASELARHRAARAPLSPGEILEIRAACPAAEGRDADLAAARFLIETPKAYDAALIGPPPSLTAPQPAQP